MVSSGCGPVVAVGQYLRNSVGLTLELQCVASVMFFSRCNMDHACVLAELDILGSCVDSLNMPRAQFEISNSQQRIIFECVQWLSEASKRWPAMGG